MENFWGTGSTRTFISYVESGKQYADDLQGTLEAFDITCFAAFRSITPTENWIIEIEKALSSMEIFVALLTEGYNASPWANQESGIAFARNIPIFTVMKDEDPGGLLSQFQAIDATQKNGEEIAVALMDVLLSLDMTNSQATEALVESLQNIKKLAKPSQLAPLIRRVRKLSYSQEKSLVNSFNTQSRVNRNSELSAEIIRKLRELTGNTYRYHKDLSTQKHQIIPNPIAPLVAGETGEICTIPGHYRPMCHPDQSAHGSEGGTFPPCNAGINGQHSTKWVLVKPDDR